MVRFGSGLLFPLYFQLGCHATVIETGIELLGLAGPTALVLPLAGRLVDRYPKFHDDPANLRQADGWALPHHRARIPTYLRSPKEWHDA